MDRGAAAASRVPLGQVVLGPLGCNLHPTNSARRTSVGRALDAYGEAKLWRDAGETWVASLGAIAVGANFRGVVMENADLLLEVRRGVTAVEVRTIAHCHGVGVVRAGSKIVPRRG